MQQWNRPMLVSCFPVTFRPLPLHFLTCFFRGDFLSFFYWKKTLLILYLTSLLKGLGTKLEPFSNIAATLITKEIYVFLSLIALWRTFYIIKNFTGRWQRGESFTYCKIQLYLVDTNWFNLRQTSQQNSCVFSNPVQSVLLNICWAFAHIYQVVGNAAKALGSAQSPTTNSHPFSSSVSQGRDEGVHCFWWFPRKTLPSGEQVRNSEGDTALPLFRTPPTSLGTLF